MSKKLFGKFFIILLVVGLLFAAAPTKQALAQSPSVWDGTYPGTKPAGMLAPVGGVQEVWTAEEFAWLAKQTNMFQNGVVNTVKLMVDIDLNNKPWTPSIALGQGEDNGYVLDGNGKTISNLSINVYQPGTIVYAGMFVKSGDAIPMPTIRNLTIDGATVTGTSDEYMRIYAGVLSASDEWRGNFENITITDAVVTGSKYVGGIAAYATGNFINCSVTDTTLVVNEKLANATTRTIPHVGALVGLLGGGQVKGNTIDNIDIDLTPPTGYDVPETQIGALIGTAQASVLVGANSVSDVTLNDVIFTKLIGLDYRTYKVVNTTQMLGYTTIQAAIDAAADGDVIEVGPGTYNEAVIINKPNLTIRSTAGAATTIIDVPFGTLTTGVKVLANMGVVTFDGFTVKNFTEGGIIQGMAARPGTTFHVLNNIVLPYEPLSGVPYLRNGIQVSGDGSTVKGNYVNGAYLTNDWSSTAILVVNASNVEVSGNTISGEEFGLDYGIGVANWDTGAMTNILIKNNIVDQADYSLDVTAYSGTISGVVIEYNKVTNYIEPLWAGISGGVSVSQVDASPNWWGSVTGPAAGQMVGDVKYLPYCTNAACTTFSEAKLSMDPATINATTCGPQYVDVMVTDVADLTAYHLEIEFDETKVRIDSVVNGGFLQETDKSTVVIEPLTDLGNGTGKLVFGAYLQAKPGYAMDPGPVSGSGSLIRINFTPLLGSTDFTVDSTNSLLVSWPDAFAMPFSATGATATLTGGLVKNVDTSVNYCSLATAVADATSGQELQLLDSFTIPATVTIDKALTLDLNGKTLTTTGTALNIPGPGALTIDDFSTGVAGSITAGYRGAQVSAGGSLVLNKGTLAGNGFDGVFVYGEASSLTVNDGAITGLYYGISGNGSSTAPYDGVTTITIKGGTVQGGETAIFHPEEGLLKITGGNIIGGSYNGIEMKAGDLEITGGTITTSAAFVATPAQTGNGNTQSGDAILIYNRAGYQGTMTVKITGGTITSTHGYALREFTYGSEPSRTTLIEITGGDFSGGTGTGEANEAVTFMTVASAILKITDGRYNYDPDEFVYAPYGSYFADPWWQIMDLTGTIIWDPGQTGQVIGDAPLGVTVTGDDISFDGLIEWYPAVTGRPEGNRVGVQITAPAGFPTAGTTFTVFGSTYNWDDVNDGDNFVWIYPLVTTTPQSWDVVVTWKPGVVQTFTISVTSTSTLTTPPAPTITSTDVEGPYIPGVPREFSLNVSNAGGAYYALATFDYKITGVSKADITSFEYFAQDLGTWIVMGSRAQETYLECDGGTAICGQFGWAPGGFGPFPADFTGVSQFRVNFKNGKTADLPLTLTLKGKKTGAELDWTVLQTFAASIDVYENVAITGTAPDYYLVGDPGTHTITITNPAGGAPYGNHIEFNLTILGAVKADIASATCTYGPVTLDILGMLTEVGGNLSGTLFPADGAFEVGAPFGMTTSCTMVFNTAKDYTSTSEMVYVVGTNKYVVATNTATAHVYTKPVITSLDLPGSFQQGVAEIVTIDVNNVDAMYSPNSFTLHLALPEGTVVVYGVDTYTCTATGCDIPVTLAAGDNAIDLTITFNAPSTADITITLVDPAVEPDRTLATFSAANVVHGNVALVTGTVTMQGRRTYTYAEFTLTGTQVGYGPYPSTRSDDAGAYSFANIIADEYTVTTKMPRYLNVTDNLLKKITLPRELPLGNVLNQLWLRGGNAVWFGHAVSNNQIDIHDANLVGTDWGGSGSTDLEINHGDVNFDNKVNIQDLALVGGNFDLTNAQAYGTWLP